MTDTKLEQRREAARRGMERLRRARGVPPRPAPSEPWEAEGISRRAWFYRRAKAKTLAAPAIVLRQARAYYNEFDPVAVPVLRELIKAGVIAPGEVDERSIEEVCPDDLKGFTQVHLFAGGGVWSVAARMAGWADDRELWTGSPPCQPFSTAGRGCGRDDPRHLWPHFHRLVRAHRPAVIVGEQVARKAGLDWFDGVANDLRDGGYAVRGIDLAAASVNAPHVRQRLYWIAADGSLARAESLIRRSSAEGHIADWRAGGDRPQQEARDAFPVIRDSAFPEYDWRDCEWRVGSHGKQRRVKPGVRLMAAGTAGRLDANRIIGNAICAPLAAQVLKTWLEVAPES